MDADRAPQTPALSDVKRALLEKRLRGAGRKSPAGGEIATGGEGVDRPLSFTQEQVWYLNQLQPDSPYYNVPGALRLAGALDVDALHRTLSEIVRRHAVLRSRVSLTGGEARARVLPAAERVELPVDSLEHLPHEEREEEARRIVAAEARRPFDLVGGPPCRFRLIRMGPGDHAFTVNLHFMAVDAWSWGVFFHELDRIYEAYERGFPPLSRAPPAVPGLRGVAAEQPAGGGAGAAPPLLARAAGRRPRGAGAPHRPSPPALPPSAATRCASPYRRR
jgi:hypothetical protein